MLNILLIIGSTLGGTYDGKIPADWVTVYRRALEAIAPTDNTWMEYYRTGRPPADVGTTGRIQFAPLFFSPTMQWAVPNRLLQGAPQGPMAPFPDFGSYSPYVPVTPTKNP